MTEWQRINGNEKFARRAKSIERRIDRLEDSKTFVSRGSPLNLDIELGETKAKEVLRVEDCTVDVARTTLFHDAVERNSGFYKCPVEAKVRSLMNVVFTTPSEDLDAAFVKEAGEQGMSGLKGHRSVGGCRASIYNAMPDEGVAALTSFMADFQDRNG